MKMENWCRVVSTHLNDVVPAEDPPRVASVAMLSDSALKLRGNRQEAIRIPQLCKAFKVKMGNVWDKTS